MAKRHHYVPVTYLKGFTHNDGKLLVYRKDEPDKPFRQQPKATGFERYYYSQIAEDGTRDDDRFEQLFSEVESRYPNIVAALERREATFPDAPHLITFVSLMRVRGPGFRDMVELERANTVKTTLQAMVETGKIDPPPCELSLDDIVVSIDPHQSLLAMATALSAIGELLQGLHFDVLHNATAMPFLTSDNPVIYFDPNKTELQIQPYNLNAEGRIELLFPISPNMLLRGRRKPVRANIGHRNISDLKFINRTNRLICRFGYKTVFASRPGFDHLISSNAAHSPVPRFDEIPDGNGGVINFVQMIFGPRPDKAKWVIR
ncbi:DUF4238 domain-containing protein [Blastomonas fulva]|jgi:hypothetical protein|uniref:DUF4238 domain-containing protein n=1 Tax=Blastomonas fulva TaxID=1550728 RepID=UPI003D2D7BC3